MILQNPSGFFLRRLKGVTDPTGIGWLALIVKKRGARDMLSRTICAIFVIDSQGFSEEQ
jgi:hypothetical protein